MGTFTRKSLLLSATVLFACVAPLALADDKDRSGEIIIAQAGSPPPAAASDTKVEKVTVTATRRSTALQKTPIAVTAIGAKTAEDARSRTSKTSWRSFPLCR